MSNNHASTRRRGGKNHHLAPINPKINAPLASNNNKDLPPLPSSAVGYRDSEITLVTDRPLPPVPSEQVPSTQAPLIRDDGTVSFTREDCLQDFRSLADFRNHEKEHLIHEKPIAYDSCGMLFTDDDHKENHLNSCPKLPTFDKIGSSKDGLSKLLKKIIGSFHV